MIVIISTGFTSEEQQVIESWSKNISSEFSEGFSVGSSLQVGRLIEINQDYLQNSNITLSDLIQQARECRQDFDEYLEHLTEIRFFYNKKLDCIFSTSIEEVDENLLVTVTKIPFTAFFAMVDNGKSKAYLGVEEEDTIISDNDIELVEIGFLSRYLVVHFIDECSAFLIEGKDFKEFRDISKFIHSLGNTIGWNWYKENQDNKEQGNKDIEEDKEGE